MHSERRALIEWRALDGSVVTSGRGTAIHPFVTIGVRAMVDPRWVQTHALVDTGASNTALTQALIAATSLVRAATTVVDSGAGNRRISTYRATIHLAAAPKLEVQTIVGEMAPLTFSQAHAVLGMDLLSFGTLHLEGPGGLNFFEYHPEHMSPLA